MIGKLKGIIDSYGEDFIIVDVNGVGYVVHCSARTLQSLPPTGDPVSLAIETHVREDQIRLFGFTSDIEREWFRLLQTVQGVGTQASRSRSSRPCGRPTSRARSRCATRRWWRVRPASARRSPSASSPN